jgi:hypothetical protein
MLFCIIIKTLNPKMSRSIILVPQKLDSYFRNCFSPCLIKFVLSVCLLPLLAVLHIEQSVEFKWFKTFFKKETLYF